MSYIRELLVRISLTFCPADDGFTRQEVKKSSAIAQRHQLNFNRDSSISYFTDKQHFVPVCFARYLCPGETLYQDGQEVTKISLTKHQVFYEITIHEQTQRPKISARQRNLYYYQ